METIKFKCSNCNCTLSAAKDYAGKQVRCAKCREVIRVPGPAGEPGTEGQQVIKFRCPSCNQKIGVTSDYAGKNVRCSKCKSPLRVPQLPRQPARPLIGDEAAILRAGQERPVTEQEGPEKPESRDELLLAKVPPIEGHTEEDLNGYKLSESEFPAYAEQLPAPGSLAEVETGGAQPKKKGSKVVLAIVCVLAVVVVGIVAWIFISGSDTGEVEAKSRFPEVKEFAKDYIDLLSKGKVDEARKLLSAELQIEAEKEEFERLAEYISKGELEELRCAAINVEENPEGDQFYLYYAFRREEGYQSIVLSVLEVDEELSVSGIAAREPFGNAISIGPHSFAELQEKAFAAFAAKIKTFFTRFFCGFMVVMLVAVIVQTISMWIVFEKADRPGWAILIPGYNMWVLAEVGDKPGWMGLLMFFSGFIPYVGFLIGLVLSFMISIGVARAFGRGAGFGVGLALLPIVFYPILAFASE